MGAAGARRVASTAFAAVLLVLTSDGSALADPPVCTSPSTQTAVSGFPEEVSLVELCSHPGPDELSFSVPTDPPHGTAETSEGFLYYTSDPGYVGPDTVSFTATAGGETTASTVPFMVVANQPPTCPAELAFVVEPEEPSSFDPHFRCQDDGDIVDFSILEPPDHGSLDAYDYDEGFIYTSASGFTGVDQFKVVAEDHAGVRSQPIVITMQVANVRPSCKDQLTVSVPFGGTVTVDPRTTCSDANGDVVSFVVVIAPSNGRLTSGAGGTLVYVANPAFIGYDRLLYRVSDGGLRSNLAALDFLVSPPVLPAFAPDLTAPDVSVGRVGAGKLGAVRRNGLKLRLSSDEGGTAVVRLSVTRRIARRLRLDRRATAPVEVGRATQVLAAGETEIVVRLTTRARRAFGRAKRVPLTVVASVRDTFGNTATERLRMMLRR
jgi:hypothetical protein